MKKRTKVKRKKANAKTEQYNEPVVKKPTIPKDELEKFIGYVKNLNRIDCKWVFPDGEGDRYRVNVYSETYEEGSIYPRLNISHSFSVYYDGENLVDKTKA